MVATRLGVQAEDPVHQAGGDGGRPLGRKVGSLSLSDSSGLFFFICLPSDLTDVTLVRGEIHFKARVAIVFSDNLLEEVNVREDKDEKAGIKTHELLKSIGVTEPEHAVFIQKCFLYNQILSFLSLH